MLTYRHRNWLTSVYGFDAARQSIGSPERKTSRPVVANVLFDLEHQPLALVVDFQTAVDLGKIVRRECNVDDRADNLDYFAFATLCHLRQAPIWCCHAVRSAGRISSIVVMSWQTGFLSSGKRRPQPCTPATPPTMSSSSPVMASCRALFISNVRSSINSFALSVAFCIAIMRAECSLAWASRIA